jgi:hypothetical protein
MCKQRPLMTRVFVERINIAADERCDTESWQRLAKLLFSLAQERRHALIHIGDIEIIVRQHDAGGHGLECRESCCRGSRCGALGTFLLHGCIPDIWAIDFGMDDRAARCVEERDSHLSSGDGTAEHNMPTRS